MRYTLRNKDRLTLSFGRDFVDLLISSLDTYFKDRVIVPEIKEINGKMRDYIEVPYTETSVFQFIIIKQTYDVLLLAYYPKPALEL